MEGQSEIIKSNKIMIKKRDGLAVFYSISTIIGYLMPNPVYTYILNTWFENTFSR